MATRPYSIHTHGVPREIPIEYTYEEEELNDWPRKEEDIVQPGQTKDYIWRVTKGSAPTDKDFDCRAWSYYSDVNPVSQSIFTAYFLFKSVVSIIS